MRLIDANALIAEQCGQCDGACEMFDVEKCLTCKSDFRCDLREAIDNAPTLDYAPVRHGEWMPWYKEDKNHKTGFSRGLRQLGWWCSACHGRSNIRTNFCPTCGALMDGKEDAHV